MKRNTNEWIIWEEWQKFHNRSYSTPGPCFTPACFTSFCFNTPCQFTSLLYLWSRIFGLTPFGRLCSIMLAIWWEHHFWLKPFLFTSTFSGMQLGHKEKGLVYQDNYMSQETMENSGLIWSQQRPDLISEIIMIVKKTKRLWYYTYITCGKRNIQTSTTDSENIL